ncbi:hypothetical protein [Shewanella gelidii]|uniref:hypothetical protein n=1 Tax=Shewanella gelidii TaxID=1642821 RepID=UPI00166E6099|nr:hypothetical protein [Shewanella gelidii]MCL1098910.1 hypothetical protein [Shewanella gelidii]
MKSEYAPMLSVKEKLLLIAKHLCWALPLLFVTETWFFPWLTLYAEVAHCHDYGWATGAELLIYGVFVGLPLSAVIVFSILLGPLSWRVYQSQQFPPPGEKVLRPTAYVYGTKARFRVYVFGLVILALFGLSVQGVFWAQDVLLESGHTFESLKSSTIEAKGASSVTAQHFSSSLSNGYLCESNGINI